MLMSKSYFTNVNRDKSLNNLAVTTRDKLPIVNTLPAAYTEGSILYNRTDTTFYGSDGVDWIPLGGTAESGTARLLFYSPLASLAPGATAQLGMSSSNNTFGDNVPIVTGFAPFGAQLSSGVWAVRAYVRMQSDGTGANPADVTLEYRLDGTAVITKSTADINRSGFEVVILDSYVQTVEGNPNELTLFITNTSAVGDDNLTVAGDPEAAAHRVINF